MRRPRLDQEEAERAAADRLFALLPGSQAAEFRALWDEFEERRTPEAKFARALDRLQPMLANYQLGGGTWAQHGVTAGQVLAKVALIEDGSAELGAFARELISASVGAAASWPPSGPRPLLDQVGGPAQALPGLDLGRAGRPAGPAARCRRAAERARRAARRR